MDGFALKLNEMMLERKITQADLCRLTGLASSMISHYCTGQRVPSIVTVIEIAKALNTTIDHLVSPPQIYEINDDNLFLGEKPTDYNAKRSACPQINEEQSMVSMFRSLNSEGRKKAIEYMGDLLAAGKYLSSGR